MATTAASTTPTRRLDAILPHLIWLVPLTLAAVPTFAFLLHQWTESVYSNGHGIMVPVLVGVLATNALREHPVKNEEPSAWGFAILIPALLLVAFDAAIRTDLLAAFAILLALPGISLLTLGPSRTKVLLLPWVLSFFMLPIPEAFLEPVHLALRNVAITGVGWVYHTVGQPSYVEGFYIHLPEGVLWVATACSGFSTLYASVTVAVVLAYLSETWRSRILLMLAAVPVALAANIARIVFLGLLLKFPNGNELLDSWLHPASGWATFMIAFAALWGLADMGRWRSPEWSESPAAMPSTSRS